MEYVRSDQKYYMEEWGSETQIIMKKMSERLERKVLQWFRHLKRINGERLTKIVYETEVQSKGERIKPICALPAQPLF